MVMNICVVLAGVLLAFSSAHASEGDGDGIVLNGTRLIYPASQKEVTLGLENEGRKPFLVQAWISQDKSDATPTDANVPFIIVPPLLRIEGEQQSALRILQIPNDLPDDRESLFWLSVLAIPGETSGTVPSPGLMQLAIESRIKLFYRPEKLKAAPERSAENLTWQWQEGGSTCTLIVRNSGPYFVSVAEFSVGGLKAAGEDQPLMVSPFASERRRIECPGAVRGSALDVNFETIDDLGVVQRHKAQASLL